MRLSLEGIGATLSSQDGYTVVEQLVKGGAAEKSGKIQTQDKIIAVGQGEKGTMDSVVDMPLKDVVRLIRGAKDTKVRLSILRKEGAKAQQFNVVLTRQKVALEEEAAKIHYVDRTIGGKKMKLGIIDLPSFYADTKRGGRSSARDVKKLLEDARKNKAEGIVLDLASNGGGSLEDAVNLAGLFFKKGNVVSTQSRKAESADVLSDEDATVDWPGPLVVLTSRLSASASEIVAGALKDYKRALIVGGDHTFGKGSVQSVVTLPNSLGAIKVTVGMFFIPGGQSTQHQGVAADIPLPGAFNRDEIGEKSLDYSLPPKQIKPFLSEAAAVTTGPDAWKPVTKELVAELKKASEKRVEQDEEFKKIKTELEKALAKGKVVTVAEVLEKKEETKENEKKRKARQKDAKLRTEEYLKRADLQEATNVLADMVVAQQKANVIANGSAGGTEKKN
jgi:carboxyl-terminal processing protease